MPVPAIMGTFAKGNKVPQAQKGSVHSLRATEDPYEIVSMSMERYIAWFLEDPDPDPTTYQGI